MPGWKLILVIAALVTPSIDARAQGTRQSELIRNIIGHCSKEAAHWMSFPGIADYNVYHYAERHVGSLLQSERMNDDYQELREWRRSMLAMLANPQETPYNRALADLHLCFENKLLGLSNPAPAKPAAPAPPVAAAPAQLSDETRLASVNAFRAEFGAFRQRYPIIDGWSEAEQSQYRLFMGINALAILDKHKPGMEKAEYDTIAAPGITLRDTGRAGCPACKVEYPGPPKPPTMALRLAGIYGTRCVTPTIRNIRKPAEANPLPNSWVGDWVLTNKCPTDQWVRIETGGPHLSWSGLHTPGARMQPSPRLVPPLPFQPIQEHDFGFGWRVPANSEIVTDNRSALLTQSPLEVWIASCDATGDAARQAIYLSAPFKANPQVACYNHGSPNSGP